MTSPTAGPVSAVHLRLYYLDHPFWRAECIRLAFHIHGLRRKTGQLGGEDDGPLVTFEDQRVNMRAVRQDAATFNRLFPLGQYPTLGVSLQYGAAGDKESEEDVTESILAEVQAIASFAGKLCGMYPKPAQDPLGWLGAQIDQALGALTSATDLLTSTMGIQPPERKVQVRAQLCDSEQGRLTQFVAGLETILEKANTAASKGGAADSGDEKNPFSDDIFTCSV
eukprot:g3788.t1